MKVSVVSFLLLAASVCSALTVEEQAASLIQCVGAGQGDPAALAALINQFPLDTTSASKFAKTVDLRTVGYDNTKHAKKKRKKVKKCVNKIKKASKYAGPRIWSGLDSHWGGKNSQKGTTSSSSQTQTERT